MAWLLAQKPWIVPIPGTTQMAHMVDNIGAADVTFSADELQALNAGLAAITVQGERLPPAVLVYSGVATALLLWVTSLIVELRVTESEEQAGLDLSLHRERLGG